MTCTIIINIYSNLKCASNVVKIKCLTHYRSTHSSVSLNTAYTEHSIMCVHVCLQCMSRIGKGSPRGTLDEIAIYELG